MQEIHGPISPFGQMMHAMKYRAPGETFDDYCIRYARTVSNPDNPSEFRRLLHYLRDQSILPGGRQQLAVGRPHQTTAFQCFVMGQIPDDTSGIFEAVRDAAMTLRAGGGVGMDFSTLRPQGEKIRGLGHGAFSSGPISFMGVWNEMSRTIMSAGERRGAMMGVLSIHHPDIMSFVRAKRDQNSLTMFNISVTVTDEFMEALDSDGLYKLRFGDSTHSDVRAVDVWAAIMENNFDWAEPGVIFIDRVNKLNPLYYCENIYATNPCAEQPLPPWGACLLGSINLVKFLVPKSGIHTPTLASVDGRNVLYEIDMERLEDAVDASVRAFDMVIEKSTFPLPQQREEAFAKRRMGVGVTGLANTLEICGHPYASSSYMEEQDRILEAILIRSYRTSMELAKEKGVFPLWDAEKHCSGEFIKTSLPEDLRGEISRYGLRNGLLTSIAPTGTISQVTDYVSSGIEPVFMIRGKRRILTPEGEREFDVKDYAAEFYGVEGRTADEVSAEEHVDVLCRAQRYVDSSISKTCNVSGQIGGKGPGTTFSEFKDLYLRAYKGGAKSCSTFNINGKRMGILTPDKEEITEGAACFIDPETGVKQCGD